MNTDKLEDIKERYNLAKKLAKDIRIDGDYEGDDNTFYYFQCGFVAGMNYKLYKDYFDENEEKLSNLDQELGLS